jgi:hypothetical protein
MLLTGFTLLFLKVLHPPFPVSLTESLLIPVDTCKQSGAPVKNGSGNYFHLIREWKKFGYNRLSLLCQIALYPSSYFFL